MPYFLAMFNTLHFFRVHLNDFENIVPFFFLGLFFTMITGGRLSEFYAKCIWRFFFFSRIGMSICHYFEIQVWTELSIRSGRPNQGCDQCVTKLLCPTDKISFENHCIFYADLKHLKISVVSYLPSWFYSCTFPVGQSWLVKTLSG